MKFQPSAIAATNLSGKSGGTVATITNTFRRKSNPRQPRTPDQGSARARLVSLSTGWGALTEAQQNSWIAAAPNFVFFDKGESYTLKGNTLYQKLNNNLLRAGQPVIDTAPLPAAFPNVSIDYVDLIYDNFPEVWSFGIYTFSLLDFEGFTIMGVATPGFPPGRRSVKNKLRELGEVLDDGAGVILITDEYFEKFPVPAFGMRMECGFYLISNTTGQASQIQTAQGIVHEIN